ncbi:hypothetical protein [Arcanobacterium canis]
MGKKINLGRFRLAEPPQVTAFTIFAYTVTFFAGIDLVIERPEIVGVYMAACALLLGGPALGVPSAWSGRFVEWEQAAAAATGVGWLFYAAEVAAIRSREGTDTTPGIYMGIALGALFFGRAFYASAKAAQQIDNPKTVVAETQARAARAEAEAAYRKAIQESEKRP